MKLLMVTFAFLMSAQTYALTCTSESDSAKKIQLEVITNGLVKAEASTNQTTDVFAGTVDHSSFQDVYSLYNQDGELSQLVVQTFSIGTNFCRTRVCDQFPTDPKLTAKLTNAEGEDEYFKCL